jgi:hypothetical protein
MLTLLLLAFMAMVLGIGEICRDLYHDVSLYSAELSADEVNAIVCQKVDEALLPDRINAVVRENVMRALAADPIPMPENHSMRLTWAEGVMVCRNEAIAHLLALTLEAAGYEVEVNHDEGERLLLPHWDEDNESHAWTAA